MTTNWTSLRTSLLSGHTVGQAISWSMTIHFSHAIDWLMTIFQMGRDFEAQVIEYDTDEIDEIVLRLAPE